jgi:hypothetical protein
MLGTMRSVRTIALSLALAARAAGAAPPQAPREVAVAFYGALHRLDAGAAAALATGPDAARTLAAWVELARAFARLEEALAARFGPDAGSRVGYRAKVKAEADAVQGSRLEAEGDRARVLADDGRVIAALRRVEGRWKVDLSEAANLAGGVVALERDAEGTRRAAGEVVSRLRAGGYRDEEEALADFRARAARATEELPWPGEQAL